MSSVDARAALLFLKRRQRLQWIKITSAIVGGAGLALLGPMLVTLSFLMISTTLMSSYGFWGGVLDHRVGDTAEFLSDGVSP